MGRDNNVTAFNFSARLVLYKINQTGNYIFCLCNPFVSQTSIPRTVFTISNKCTLHVTSNRDNQ